MIFEKSLEGFLGKRKCTAYICLQALLKLLARLFEEGFLGRVLDAVDCHVELEPFEALVCFDVAEGFFERLLGCVGWEGFEDGGGVRGVDGGDA